LASNITMVVTSCDRHDLLRDTLNSFIRVHCGGMRPDRCIVVEDSTIPMPAWLQTDINYYSTNLGCITWFNNGSRRGQVYSIDRAYSFVTIDYVFHLEDDWHFNECGFMRESMKILQRYPEIIQVSLRGDTGWHQLIDSPRYPFKIAMPYWGNDWGGLSWNPGLRRLSDYKRIGSYGCHAACGTHGLVHEALLSRKYLDMGYRIADLGRPIVSHIGGARSRATEPLGV
jgi:hypothetical protein